MLSQLATSEIRSGDLEKAADHIQRLNREFPNQHHDIRIGLSCQLEIARRRYRDALVLWNQLREKDKPVHLALRRNAINGLLTGALPDAERIEYTREVEEISAQLGDRDGTEWGILDEDI